MNLDKQTLKRLEQQIAKLNQTGNSDRYSREIRDELRTISRRANETTFQRIDREIGTFIAVFLHYAFVLGLLFIAGIVTLISKGCDYVNYNILGKPRVVATVPIIAVAPDTTPQNAIYNDPQIIYPKTDDIKFWSNGDTSRTVIEEPVKSEPIKPEPIKPYKFGDNEPEEIIDYTKPQPKELNTNYEDLLMLVPGGYKASQTISILRPYIFGE